MLHHVQAEWNLHYLDTPNGADYTTERTNRPPSKKQATTEQKEATLYCTAATWGRNSLKHHLKLDKIKRQLSPPDRELGSRPTPPTGSVKEVLKGYQK